MIVLLPFMNTLLPKITLFAKLRYCSDSKRIIARLNGCNFIKNNRILHASPRNRAGQPFATVETLSLSHEEKSHSSGDK